MKKIATTNPVRPNPGAPLSWCGATPGAWLRMLGDGNLWRVNWRCWPALIFALLISPVCWVSSVLQRSAIKRRMTSFSEEPAKAPIFVIGHWRCGTSLLQELLALDSNFRTPLLYECFAPNHILLPSGWVLRKISERGKSVRRPMDDMPFSLNSPGEDEFALFIMGEKSPMAEFMFPGASLDTKSAIAVEQAGPNETRRWKSTLQRFHTLMTCAHGPEHQIVYKSPAHTARIELLLGLFPDAHFVHIVRNPNDVLGSMRKMFRALSGKWSLKNFSLNTEEENQRILSNFAFMHEQFEAAHPLIPENRLHMLRFEDLIADPSNEMEMLYKEFDLGGFDEVQPKIDSYFALRKSHRVSRYELTKEERALVHDKLEGYIQKHNYEE